MEVEEIEIGGKVYLVGNTAGISALGRAKFRKFFQLAEVSHHDTESFGAIRICQKRAECLFKDHGRRYT